MGEIINGQRNSITIIERGISDLGPLLVFYKRLVSIHEKYNQFDKAIEYQSTIVNLSNRKEFPFFKRAELCLISGNQEAAMLDLAAAKKAINSLSPSRRKNSAITSLLTKITNIEETLN